MGTGTLTANETVALALSEAPADGSGIVKATKQIAGLMPYTDPAYLSNSLQSLAAQFDSFNTGKVAMAIGLGCCSADAIGDLDPERVGVITSLGAGSKKGGNYQSAGPDFAWMIPNYSKNKKAAVAYVKYLMSKEVQGALFTKAGVLPNNFAVDIDSGGEGNAFAARLYDAYRGGKTLNGIHAMWPSAVEDEYQRQMQAVLAGQASVSDALAAVLARQKLTESITGK
jgi:ABC-type glycerol-3-phosphate transport system substrate-binding protein